MRGSQKLKRISWASDVNLCQVRLFLSEDSPSQVGSGAQDHLQAKRSWVSHPTGATTDDVLPPGFGGANSATCPQIDVSDIPVIKWKCPLRFLLDIDWQVVAGEESGEVETENKRGLKVLEAVYPRPSAIPPNPLVTVEVENECNNDHQPPLIPVSPVEDDDAAFEPLKVPHNENPTAGMPLNINPSIVAAALTAITKGNEQGNVIDPDLLMKVLGNQNLLQNLVTNHGSTQITPNIQASGTSLAGSSSGSFYPQPNGAGAAYSAPGVHLASSSPTVGPPAGTNDFNHYKNLIQQHGGERQEPAQQYGNNRFNQNQHIEANQDLPYNPKPRDFRHKIMKPCIFFNSPRGCRNGTNCPYQHDASTQERGGNGMAEMPNAKRMKMGREISS